MNKFLIQVEALLNAQVLPDVKAAESQGTAALRELADYFDAQIAGFKFAGPDDAARCTALAAKCHEALAKCPKGALAIGSGQILSIILTVLQTVLSELSAQQTPTT